MINNPVMFYIASAILVIFTVLSLFAKNLIYSLLSAIMVFFSAALIFYFLGSEYNAIIQAVVYGFAVPVIIGVSIMFMSNKKESEKHGGLNWLIALAAGLFIMAFIYLVMISLAVLPDTFHITETVQTSSYDNINAFSNGIFVNYVWGFELLSLLLTIVIAGLTMLKRRDV